MYRYWTGSAWSASVTNNPMQQLPQGGFGTHQQPPPSWNQNYQPRRSPVGWWIAIAVAVLVLGLIGWFAVRNLGGILGAGPSPGSNPTQNACPKQVRSTATPAAPTSGSRVYGGALSYPRLGSPWQAPEVEDRVPFGRDVLTQTVTIEPNYQRQKSWVASVLVGELVAGDGFFSPQQGSEIVVKCIMGVFYGDAEVGRADKLNQAATVDGKDAWLVETQLSFDIQGLKAKSELALVLIVATKSESSSIYYASIPENADPQLTRDARAAMAGLRVES